MSKDIDRIATVAFLGLVFAAAAVLVICGAIWLISQTIQAVW